MPTNNITIVVPVYGDWPSLKLCIESLIKYIDTSKHSVMFVNDCGPEVESMERNIRSLIKGITGFSYYRNSKNLGFVGTCNRAVNVLDTSDNDILLLNSDTEVTRNFLEELSTVLNAKENIGAVSPRTNNATICTFPLWAMKQRGILAKKSYNLFVKYHMKFPKYDEAPTAHGFCLLTKRSLIKKYGLFDSAFGKGYGEEVDYCQRLRKEGFKSVISNWSYVFHLEARSFSIESKIKLLENSKKIINKRYPNYSSEVRKYIETALLKEQNIFGKKTKLSTTASRIKSKLIRSIRSKS